MAEKKTSYEKIKDYLKSNQANNCIISPCFYDPNHYLLSIYSFNRLLLQFVLTTEYAAERFAQGLMLNLEIKKEI
jgi:hypothetical protein